MCESQQREDGYGESPCDAVALVDQHLLLLFLLLLFLLLQLWLFLLLLLLLRQPLLGKTVVSVNDVNNSV